MTRLSIPDMTCGHCKATVEKTVTGLDPAAKVAVDLATQSGLTLVGFLRGQSMNVYSRPDRVKR